MATMTDFFSIDSYRSQTSRRSNGAASSASSLSSSAKSSQGLSQSWAKRSLPYGNSRSKTARSGLGSRLPGMGPGQRHGMSADAVERESPHLIPYVLGNGMHVLVDQVCRHPGCGHEQPVSWKRLRCQSCDTPLRQFSEKDQRWLRSSYQGAQHGYHALSSPGSRSVRSKKFVSATSVALERRRVVADDEVPDGFSKLSLPYGESRLRALGGQGSRPPGMRAGQRHGMSEDATHHMPAMLRPFVLGDGTRKLVDIQCRKCGHQQPPIWRGLRCQAVTCL